MKKAILIVSMFFGIFILNANAIEVIGKENKGDYLHISIQCNNGQLTVVSHYYSNGAYWGGQRQFSNLNNAAVSACNYVNKGTKKDTNRIKISKGAVVYKKRVQDDGIESYLVKDNKKLAVSQAKTSAHLGNKNFLQATKIANAKVMKYYSPHKVTVDKYGNYINSNSNGKHTKLLVEGYYKVKYSNKIYFVRESDTF